jgi:hypothetical protein
VFQERKPASTRFYILNAQSFATNQFRVQLQSLGTTDTFGEHWTRSMHL